MAQQDGLLFGLGIASLTAGIAALTAGGFLTWLNKSRCYKNYTRLGKAGLDDSWELSNIVIQGEITKHLNDDNIFTNPNDLSQEEAAILKCNDYGPAGIATHLGRAESHNDPSVVNNLYSKIKQFNIFKNSENQEIESEINHSTERIIPTMAPNPPITFSAPFILSDSQNIEIHVKEIDMVNGFRSVRKDVEIKSYDFPEETYDLDNIPYTRSDLRYNILPYGITVAILGDARKVKGNKNITFYPEEVGKTAESFVPTIKLGKFTYRVLIIGGITIIIAGVVLLGILGIRWYNYRRRNPRDDGAHANH